MENIEECTFYGSPKFDFNVTGFKNGVLDHKKKVLMPWSPKFFISHALPFNYDPTATCEKFRSYLDDICEKNNDRKMFLKSFAWALIHGRSSFQVMLHLIGPGGTGKSIFGLLMTALVGKEVTVTTTLKAIQGNSFENSNLVGKKLILVSDAENYRGDLSSLKQLTGGDALMGRIKHRQGATEITDIGMVLIIGNHCLRTQDASGAIARRYRPFTVNKIPKDRILLLRYHKDWEGIFVKEFAGIYNWALECAEEEARRFLVDTAEHVPTLRQELDDARFTLDPLREWAEEELQK